MSLPTTERAIGGFLTLELPLSTGGARRAWGMTDERLAFASATSALRALLMSCKTGDVWLPAYICPKFASAVPPHRLRFYPVGEVLEPDVERLDESLRSGDICLGVDFFGRAPSARFVEFACARQDVLFVEDCAQALDTTAPPWGDWRIFSPRKLLGVADGGVLVPTSRKADPIGIESRPDLSSVGRVLPQLMRFEDTLEFSSEAWHLANQKKELELGLNEGRISRLAWEMLGLLDVEAPAARRRDNFAVLGERLGEWAFFDDPRPRFAPLGFPVLLAEETRDAVRNELIAERIFPAIHWDHLLAPPESFDAEHRLSRRLLTLPCDHRYTPADMERVARVFEKAVG
jgi:dTDP-4-amino-4,6-dideoxygalactose transaminase